ncbi:hypothetical protein [Stappia sp. ES.058]|uniref:hypothetical protein n=1 Tax=Stappia sp. ES.058 TaxID=1881061 RepID=UPI0012FE4BAF|nr:hypothetical protein [Stappia sp. ES.058]
MNQNANEQTHFANTCPHLTEKAQVFARSQTPDALSIDPSLLAKRAVAARRPHMKKPGQTLHAIQ